MSAIQTNIRLFIGKRERKFSVANIFSFLIFLLETESRDFFSSSIVIWKMKQVKLEEDSSR